MIRHFDSSVISPKVHPLCLQYAELDEMVMTFHNVTSSGEGAVDIMDKWAGGRGGTWVDDHRPKWIIQLCVHFYSD